MTDIIDDDDDVDLPDDENECLYCGEFGRDREMWFRCVVCGKWAHKDCSGWDTAENYTCDYCKKRVMPGKEKRMLKF